MRQPGRRQLWGATAGRTSFFSASARPAAWSTAAATAASAAPRAPSCESASDCARPAAACAWPAAAAAAACAAPACTGGQGRAVSRGPGSFSLPSIVELTCAMTPATTAERSGMALMSGSDVRGSTPSTRTFLSTGGICKGERSAWHERHSTWTCAAAARTRLGHHLLEEGLHELDDLWAHDAVHYCADYHACGGRVCVRVSA